MQNYFKIACAFAVMALVLVSCSDNSTDPENKKSYVIYNYVNANINGPEMLEIKRLDIDGQIGTVSTLFPEKNMILSKLRNGKVITCEYINEKELILYLTDLSTGTKIQIDELESGPYILSYFHLSQDGSKVYYAKAMDNESELGKIVEFDATMAKKTTIKENVTSPIIALSPDEKWIAYYTYTEDDNRAYLYKCRVDGSDVMKLSNTEINDFDDKSSAISWSPDGTVILVDDRGNNHLAVLSDGTGETILPIDNNLTIAFSPTKNQIVYDSYISGDIYIKDDPDAAPVIMATPNADTLKYLYPVWSNDGEGISFIVVNLVEQSFRLATYEIASKTIMIHEETKFAYNGDNFDNVQYILPMISKPYWVR